jgi:hypothetical protein
VTPLAAIQASRDDWQPVMPASRDDSQPVIAARRNDGQPVNPLTEMTVSR